MSFAVPSEPVPPSGTLSQQAEEALVLSILDIDIFRPLPIERRLAYYPYAQPHERARVICELMERLWDNELENKLFPAYQTFDGFLSTLGRRGHFVHQFEVYLLGMHIINNLLKLSNDFVGWRQKPEQIYDTWLLAATAHDFGYPIEVASDFLDHLAKLHKELGFNYLSTKYLDLKEYNPLQKEENLLWVEVNVDGHNKERMHLCDFVYTAIGESLGVEPGYAAEIGKLLSLADNHGYVSAMILARTVLTRDVSLEDMRKSGTFDCMMQAIGAIALHNLPRDLVEKIQFDLNPFSYLLFLVDNIQDWARSPEFPNEWPIYHLSTFKGEANTTTFKYVLSHEKWTPEMKERVEQSLQQKHELIETAKSPSEQFGYKLLIKFESNDGTELCPQIEKRI